MFYYLGLRVVHVSTDLLHLESVHGSLQNDVVDLHHAGFRHFDLAAGFFDGHCVRDAFACGAAEGGYGFRKTRRQINQITTIEDVSTQSRLLLENKLLADSGDFNVRPAKFNKKIKSKIKRAKILTRNRRGRG